MEHGFSNIRRCSDTQEVYAQAGIIDLELPEELRYRLRGYLHNMHKSGVLRNFTVDRPKAKGKGNGTAANTNTAAAAAKTKV